MAGELDLDKLADEVDGEVTAEEGGETAAEEVVEEVAAEETAQDDDERFASDAAKQKLHTVPYKRFQKVYNDGKEAKKWRKENEARIQYAQAYENEVNTLKSRFKDHPWFQELVGQMLSDPSKIDWKKMAGEVGKLTKAEKAGV